MEVCHNFNTKEEGCKRKQCPYAHVCSGCGANWPFRTCRKCNPEGAQKAGKGKTGAGKGLQKGEILEMDSTAAGSEGKKKRKTNRAAAAAAGKGGGSRK